MAAEVEIVETRLPIARDLMPATRAFYSAWGAEPRAGREELELPVGDDLVVFVPAESGRPFHHFALLVPGDRFEAAQTWLATQAELLHQPGQPTTFDSEDWNSRASYVLDPAGNIVELIAHHDLHRSAKHGRFSPDEFCAISELGLVVSDRVSALTALQAHGLTAWSGTVADNRVLFVGEKGRTLILAPPGRGWLPTGRPAEPWPVSVTVVADQHRIPIAVEGGTLSLIDRFE